MKNIYFVAKAGSGKTCLCDYLVKKYNYKQAKMAYSVYMICEKYLGMKKKDRTLLQVAGTDIGRNQLNEFIWVRRFCEDIDIANRTSKKLYNKDLKFCSDDVRFVGEHECLKDFGWVGIFLNCPDEIRINRLKSRDGDACEERLNHASELEIDEFKNNLIQLDVSGTLEQSYENLEQTLEYINKEL